MFVVRHALIGTVSNAEKKVSRNSFEPRKNPDS
jgi:hypothetical protein